MVVTVSRRGHYSGGGWRTGDVQDIERELSWVECEFKSDGFADTPVYAACLVR